MPIFLLSPGLFLPGSRFLKKVKKVTLFDPQGARRRCSGPGFNPREEEFLVIPPWEEDQKVTQGVVLSGCALGPRAEVTKWSFWVILVSRAREQQECQGIGSSPS